MVHCLIYMIFNLTRKKCFTYVSAKHKCWKTGRKHPHMTSHILFGFNTWFLHVFLQAVIFLAKKNQKNITKTAWQPKTSLKNNMFLHVFVCNISVWVHTTQIFQKSWQKMHWKSTWPQKIKNEKKIKVIYFCFLLSKCSTVQQKSSSFIKIN